MIINEFIIIHYYEWSDILHERVLKLQSALHLRNFIKRCNFIMEKRMWTSNLMTSLQGQVETEMSLTCSAI